MKKGEFELRVVFERTNIFILATTFLMVAFTTLAIYYKQASALLLLAYAVNAVALYLAIYFTIANYHGALCYSAAKKEMISGKQVTVPKQLHAILLDLIKSILSLPSNALSVEERVAALHTWLIPFLFSLFWLVTWFCVLPIRWGWGAPSAIVLGVPLLVGMVSFLISKYNDP